MKTSFKIISILFAGLFFACGEKPSEKIEVVKVKREFPLIIDTSEIKKDLIAVKGTEDFFRWMSSGYHHPLYIGKLRDTLFTDYLLQWYFRIEDTVPSSAVTLDPVFRMKMENWELYFPEAKYGSKFPWADSTKIEILIDTTQLVRNIFEFPELDSLQAPAYSVLLKNTSPDSVFIGYGQHIPLITEAIGTDGKWKAIERRYRYFCGMGMHYILLPPGEVALTASLINKGNFKTKLRLRFGNNISKEFTGSIFKCQFEREYDEKGNKKIFNENGVAGKAANETKSKVK